MNDQLQQFAIDYFDNNMTPRFMTTFDKLWLYLNLRNTRPNSTEHGWLGDVKLKELKRERRPTTSGT
jgi:hypothetical protein